MGSRSRPWMMARGGFADGDDIAALGVGHDVATNHLNGIVEMGEEMGFDGKDVGVVFG